MPLKTVPSVAFHVGFAVSSCRVSKCLILMGSPSVRRGHNAEHRV